MAEIKYPESKTSENILARHKDGIISQEELNLYNFLASTFPEQVIETLTTDDSGGYVTEYNEDVLILLFTVAKLFGSSKEVIKDLDYAYNANTLKTFNKPNTDNLLLLLADQVNFSYLEGQSLEDLTKDARDKSAFIENYGAIKRRRGTRKALEIILDLFKNYIIETGVLEEFKYSIKIPSEEAPIKELYIILQDYDFNTFTSKDNQQYIDYNNKTYIKLKQDHFLYKMIMDIKPAGVVYNIILNYIATVLYTQEEVVAYQNRDKQFIKPKLEFEFDTNGGTPTNIAPKVFETQSVRFADIIHGVNISQEHHYFNYWKDLKGREPSISDTYTANETFTAVWYKRKKATIKFYQTDQNNNNATLIEDSDIVLYGNRQDNVVITPNRVPTPDSYGTYGFDGWVDSNGNSVPLNSNYIIKVSEDDTEYEFYTTYSPNPRLSAPAIVKAEAVTTGARTSALVFRVTVRNTDTQPARIQANIGDTKLTSSEVLPNGEYTFSARLPYTAETRPATTWATVQALATKTKPNSVYSYVNQTMWQMTGVAREPEFDLQIRQVNMKDIFKASPLSIPHDTLNHEKVLGSYNWMILAEARIIKHRDWRSINTYIKVGPEEILLSKEPKQVAFYANTQQNIEKQIRISGAVNQTARNLDSIEYDLEENTNTGKTAPTIEFPNNYLGKPVTYTSATGLPATVEMTPIVEGSSLDEPAYVIPIIKYTSKALFGQTRWRGKSDGVLEIYKNGYGGNRAYIYLDADGPTGGNFPDKLDIYYIVVTIDKNLRMGQRTLDVHKIIYS